MELALSVCFFAAVIASAAFSLSHKAGWAQMTGSIACILLAVAWLSGRHPMWEIIVAFANAAILFRTSMLTRRSGMSK